MPSPSRTRRRIALESLENRSTPAWTIGIAGNAVAFTSLIDYDAALTLSRTPAGFLQHDLSDPAYASPIDLNPNQAGVQSRRVNNLSNLTVTGTVGSSLSILDVSKNATLRVDGLSIGLETLPTATATLTNTALTVTSPNFRYTLSNVAAVTIAAGTGNNRLDATTFGGPVTLYGQDGNDTLIGGTNDDYLDGGAGNDRLVGNAGMDALFAGPGADTYDGGADDDSLYDDVTANATLSSAAITVDGTTSSNPNVETVQLNGSDAANAIDASGFTLGAVTVYANGGNDTLIGGPGPDFLSGGDGDDSVVGNDGADTLYGDTYAGGNDTLRGGAGDDYISAGGGDDTYDGGADADTIADALGEGANYDAVLTDTTITISRDAAPAVATTHGAEQFYLDGGPGNDRIDASAFTLNGQYAFGWDGNDTLIGTALGDHLYGGTGNDLIVVGGGDDSVQGDSGNDTIDGGAGLDHLEGDAGNDSLDGGTGDDRLIGDYFTDNGPLSFPTDGDDTLLGGEGNDDLRANGGADVYDGGDGTDTLTDVLGYGDDSAVLTDTDISYGPVGGPLTTFAHGAETFYLYGGPGDDVLDGSAWTRAYLTLDGNAGNDSLVGSEGQDFLAGGDGNDTLRGNGGNDDLTDTSLDNFPTGGGNDLFDGGDGADDLQAGTGDDTLLGGAGDDRLYAGAGEDTFDAGPGLDTLNDDLFDITVEGGVAVITDDLIILRRKDGTDESFAHHAELLELTGSAGNDTIDAGALTVAQVFLHGLDGNDLLIAGSWNSPYSDNTDNFLYGLGGNDTLIGGPQDDYLVAEGVGDPTLTGDDSLVGGGGHDILISEAGRDTLRGGDGPDVFSVSLGGGIADGGADDDSLLQYLSANPDTIAVAEAALTVNGVPLALSGVEQLSLFDSGGIDSGTQTGPVSFSYTVAGLEPTATLAPGVSYPSRTVGGAGSFLDIGAGQSWTATVDYGDGSDAEPLTLVPVAGSVENRHTFALNHAYGRSGTYEVTVAVTDAEGNVGTTTTTVVVAPVVTQVRVRYGNGAATVATFDQLAGRTLPWLNVSRFDVIFSDDVSVQSNDLRVTGPGSPQPTGFPYVAAERRATWVFGTAFARGRYTFTLDGDSGLAVADRAGNRLAGGATAGSDYVCQLGVLPGDVTGDSVVNQADVDAATAVIGGAYAPFADVNGDGVVDDKDVRAVRARLGTTLP